MHFENIKLQFDFKCSLIFNAILKRKWNPQISNWTTIHKWNSKISKCSSILNAVPKRKLIWKWNPSFQVELQFIIIKVFYMFFFMQFQNIKLQLKVGFWSWKFDCSATFGIGKRALGARTRTFSLKFQFGQQISVPGQYLQFNFLQWCCTSTSLAHTRLHSTPTAQPLEVQF